MTRTPAKPVDAWRLSRYCAHAIAGSAVTADPAISKMKSTLEVINRMQAEGVITDYALGGAVGATFYLEPVATLDIDVFIIPKSPPQSGLISLSPIYNFLDSCGYHAEKEYVLVQGWPVQFLTPSDALDEEAVRQAIKTEVEGARTKVISAEHLTAIALRTGRAKDFARILQFIESGVLDPTKLDQVLRRHGLLDKWESFGAKFLRGKR
jgi:hypothetical protein